MAPVKAQRRDVCGGHALAWLISIIGGAAALALVAVRIGNLVVVEAQVQAAADATALALAAGDGVDDVGDVLDGYELVTVARAGNRVEVLIGHGRVVASAAALLMDRPTFRRSGLAPSMVAALVRAEQLLGWDIVVVSGYRSAAQQLLLW